MEAIAKTKYLKGSPRKARLVIDMIRGENVSRALAILKFTDKRAADPIAKTLRSAIANATFIAEQQNIAIDPDDLWVKTCFVDIGPTKNRRRMRPAPQGRAYKEQRHYCHITIQVTSEEQAKTEKELRAAEAKAKKAAAKKTDAGEKKAKAPAKTAKKAKAPKAEEAEKPVVTETAEETVEKTAAKNEAEVSAAKDATTQTPAEQNETKPADDKQQDINEELERQ
ncbi:MAG TPA: 50S ribosomal protein L22 [Pyrinomonadaceae bacterium]|jgi:large subunit ribosomal protein L22|nr:50S ribosomal protein L22 [Pyrinomonadaceae bacterium]